MPTATDNILISGKVHARRSRSRAGRAAHVAEVSVKTGYVEHAYIEPEAGIRLDGRRQGGVHACTQAPVMDRDEMAVILGLARERVRIIPAAAGGGFGSKLDLSVQPLIGAGGAEDRPAGAADLFAHANQWPSTTKRHPATMTARAGINAQGQVVGMAFDGDFNTGAYAQLGANGGGPGAGACLGALPGAELPRRGPRGPYQLPAIGGVSGLWRSAGGDRAGNAV